MKLFLIRICILRDFFPNLTNLSENGKRQWIICDFPNPAPATIPAPLTDPLTMPLDLPGESPWPVFTANPADNANALAHSCDDPSAGSAVNAFGTALGSALACSCDDPNAASGSVDNALGKWLGNHLGLSLRRILATM
jgi:hypothetical protein